MTMPIAQILNLTGKGAIVTGGGKGIGQAISFRLAEAGAMVMIADLDLDAAEQTAAEIVLRGGIAKAIKADISIVDDCNHMVKQTAAEFGTLDILVNNAGFIPPLTLSALNTTEADWDKSLSINLKGVFFCSRAAAEVMKDSGRGGKILNIGSVAGIRPELRMNSYNAAKGGVNALTRSLALELAPHNILVNTIVPGGIYTPGAKNTLSAVVKDGGDIDQVKKKFTSRMPLGDWGEGDDIAKVALFMVSPGADYMTGTVVVADGGTLVT